MPTRWHLAQMNVALARWDLDTPEMVGFVEQIAAINALAESSRGFAWRWTGETGHPRRLVNFSVWETMEALKQFSYRSAHGEALRDRGRWFEKSSEPNFVLWWIPAGHQPTLEESEARLALLRASGPSSEAFTFTRSFTPPD